MSPLNQLRFAIDRTTDKKEISEYRFEATIPSENLTFSIKLCYVDCEKIYYNIYLLSTKTVSIRCRLFVRDKDTGSHIVTLSEDVMQEKYFTLECNKWHYINGSDKNILHYKYLHFYYHIIKNDKDLLSKELGNNCSTLLRGGNFTDIVTIKSVEGTEHKVHKALLVSRSEVLKAHFEHDTTESKTNIVQSPLESKVLVDVLTFIYWNTIPTIEDMPEKLLVAADYYQLHEMKKKCVEKLKEKLCVDNALDTLQFADLHSAATLKQFTLEYIKHQIVLIMKTEGWTKMVSTPLLKDIIEYNAVDVNGDIKCMKYLIDD